MSLFFLFLSHLKSVTLAKVWFLSFFFSLLRTLEKSTKTSKSSSSSAAGSAQYDEHDEYGDEHGDEQHHDLVIGTGTGVVNLARSNTITDNTTMEKKKDGPAVKNTILLRGM